MIESIFWGSCSRTWHRNAQATEHRQQHRDTSSDISLSHYLYMLHLCYSVMSTVFHPFTSCLSCTPRLSEEVWCHVQHTLDWGMISTHRDMSFPQNPHATQPKPFPLVLLEDNQSDTLEILSLSHAPFVSCKTLKLPHTAVFICVVSISMSLSQNFLLIDEITWACCPLGSRFGRLPLATNSCNSGRKPGFDLQRQIIECVFIHDQSLIQKVLGHLDTKH